MSDEGTEQRSVRVHITGRVQGVGYRVWALDNARALGLGGWVRNRRDGAVEALLSGGEGQVLEMIARCHKGPPGAFVMKVAIVEYVGERHSSFRVLPTA